MTEGPGMRVSELMAGTRDALTVRRVSATRTSATA